MGKWYIINENKTLGFRIKPEIKSSSASLEAMWPSAGHLFSQNPSFLTGKCGYRYRIVGKIINDIFLTFFLFFGPHLQHTRVPRLWVKSELQLQAYTTATATPDPSHICNVCCSLQPHRILNPPSKARDQSHILMDTSWVLNLLSYQREFYFLLFIF